MGGGGRPRIRWRLLAYALVVIGASISAFGATSLSPARGYVVPTGSMEPTIPQGSFIVTGEETVDEGDIIVFESGLGGPYVHRVINVVATPEGPRYETRGDAHDTSDSVLVAPDDVLGVVQHHVPYVGYIWLVPPAVAFTLFSVASLAYFGLILHECRLVADGRRIAVIAAVVAPVLLLPMATGAVHGEWPTSGHAADVADPSPVALAEGANGTGMVAADGNSAVTTVQTQEPDHWGEVVLWRCDPTTPGDTGCVHEPTTSWASIESSLTPLAKDFTPVPTAYLEISGEPGTAGLSARVYNQKDTVVVSGSEVTLDAAGIARSGAFTFPTDKPVELQVQQNGTAAELHSAKMVIHQAAAGKTVVRIPISAADAVTSTVYEDADRAAIWRYDAAQWDGVAGLEFEVVMSVEGTETITAALYDLTDDVAVKEHATSKNVLEVKKGSMPLTDGHDYTVRLKTASGGTGILHSASILVRHDGFTQTVRYVSLTPGLNTTASSYTDASGGARYAHGQEWPGTPYLEATLSGSGTHHARLATDQAVPGAEITGNSSTPARVRSSGFSLAAEQDFHLEAYTESGNVAVHNAWIVVPRTHPDAPYGPTFDPVLAQTPTACTWTFHLEHTASSGLARITSATISVRGDTSEDQIVITTGSVTQTSGTAVAVSGTVDHIIDATTSSSGVSQIDADVVGRCAGVETRQPVSYVIY